MVMAVKRPRVGSVTGERSDGKAAFKRVEAVNVSCTAVFILEMGSTFSGCEEVGNRQKAAIRPMSREIMRQAK